jgi:hypothetical protein
MPIARCFFALLICLVPALLLAQPMLDSAQFKQQSVSYTYGIKQKPRAVSIKGGAQYKIDAKSKKRYLTISAASDQIQKVTISLKQGTIYIVDHNHYHKKAKPQDKVFVEIGIHQLNALTANGATGWLKNLNGDKANIKLHNSTLILTAPVKTPVAVQTLTITTTGKSNVDGAPLLTAKNMVIDAADRSKLRIDVTDHLTVEASGKSRVLYANRPKRIQKKLTGQAKLEAIDSKALDFLTALNVRNRSQ